MGSGLRKRGDRESVLADAEAEAVEVRGGERLEDVGARGPRPDEGGHRIGRVVDRKQFGKPFEGEVPVDGGAIGLDDFAVPVDTDRRIVQFDLRGLDAAGPSRLPQPGGVRRTFRLALVDHLQASAEVEVIDRIFVDRQDGVPGGEEAVGLSNRPKHAGPGQTVHRKVFLTDAVL